jgi:predicted N-formylglutamate amidohydrolase
MAADLDAPLVYPRYSRLYIDCNRPPESPELIPLESGGYQVPGNHNLTPNQRQDRLDGCFWPYHHAIEALIEERLHRLGRQFILSVHSFTPWLYGQARPWDIGVTYLEANPLSRYLLTALRKPKNLIVGDNRPYEVTWQADYSIPVHAAKRGLPHVLLEIRQDLVDENAGQLCYADLLSRALADFPASRGTSGE